MGHFLEKFAELIFPRKVESKGKDHIKYVLV